jgi:hypothetical protein
MNQNNTNHRVEYTRVSSTPETNHVTTDTTTTTTSSIQQQQPTPFSLSQQPSSNNATNNNSNNNNGIPTRTITEKVMDKIFAAIWVILAGIVIHYTDSLHVYLLLSDDDNNNMNTNTKNKPTANPILMQLVMIGLGINTVLVVYLLFYLPYVKGLNDSTAWDIYCPRIIPTISIIGVCIFILLIRATWSVWGFLSPLIIGIEAMGLLFTTHFIPIGF